jgi:hypothetical protein
MIREIFRGGCIMKSSFINLKKILVLFSIGLMAGCGSGGDNDETPITAVSGSVFASHVRAAAVTVKDTAGNTVAGPVTTADDGTYTVNVPDNKLSQDLIFNATGGTFTDEATGNTGIAGGVMGAYVAGGTLNSGAEVHITPSSTIVQEMVTSYGNTLAGARSIFESGFGDAEDPALAPLDATSTPPVVASEDGLRAGLRAAALSRLAKDLVLPAADQFALFTALADDLSDGSLDGGNGSGSVTVGTTSVILPEDIQNRYERALIEFRKGPRNKTGLTADKIGALPFAKVGLTDRYKIEYIPGMMGAMEGKTTFSLNITDRTTAQGVAGLMVMLMPMMNMATMTHGSAVDGCVAGTSDGVYDCTVYYLMASSMASGMSMGYWELKITAGGGMAGESVYFYPNVMMAMGDTVRSVLKGQNDKIAGMMGMPAEPRNYYLFKDGISGSTGDHTFNLFIAARESMMSHPAVSVGTVLNDGDMTYELTVGSMTVEVSADGSTWFAATDNGNGHWSASGISGLTDDVQGTLYVKLTVNGEQKTTNGGAPAGNGTNDYGIFLVTP